MNEIAPIRPVRVLVTKEGCALPPRMAKSRYGVTPSIVFFRADGYSLAAPAELEAAAYAIWKESWIAFQRQGETMQDIRKYRPKNHGT